MNNEKTCQRSSKGIFSYICTPKWNRHVTWIMFKLMSTMLIAGSIWGRLATSTSPSTPLRTLYNARVMWRWNNCFLLPSSKYTIRFKVRHTREITLRHEPVFGDMDGNGMAANYKDFWDRIGWLQREPNLAQQLNLACFHPSSGVWTGNVLAQPNGKHPSGERDVQDLVSLGNERLSPWAPFLDCFCFAL